MDWALGTWKFQRELLLAFRLNVKNNALEGKSSGQFDGNELELPNISGLVSVS